MNALHAVDSRAEALVVAATDFTPAAAAAARRAAEIAAAGGARLVLFHAWRGGDAEGERERLRLSATRLRRAFGVPVDTQLGYGSAPAAIAAFAHGVRADLVVVGNGQADFLADLFGLNTADRVRRRAPIPVLAVSSAARRPYARVALATDLSPRTALAGRVAQRLFPKAEMRVLHANESLHEGTLHFAGVSGDLVAAYRRQALLLGERQLAQFVARYLPGLEGSATVRLGAPAAAIHEYVRDAEADVVVLSPGKSWLARAMAHSVTEQVLADPPCDVLLAGSP
ncbi:MAG: universal stress protein [Burkholderiales bacterium]